MDCIKLMLLLYKFYTHNVMNMAKVSLFTSEVPTLSFINCSEKLLPHNIPGYLCVWLKTYVTKDASKTIDLKYSWLWGESDLFTITDTNTWLGYRLWTNIQVIHLRRSLVLAHVSGGRVSTVEPLVEVGVRWVSVCLARGVACPAHLLPRQLILQLQDVIHRLRPPVLSYTARVDHSLPGIRYYHEEYSVRPHSAHC